MSLCDGFWRQNFANSQNTKHRSQICTQAAPCGSTHHAQVHDILEHEDHPERDLPLLDDLVHLAEVLVQLQFGIHLTPLLLGHGQGRKGQCRTRLGQQNKTMRSSWHALRAECLPSHRQQPFLSNYRQVNLHIQCLISPEGVTVFTKRRLILDPSCVFLSKQTKITNVPFLLAYVNYR